MASYAEEYYLEGFSDDTESTVQIARRSLDLQNSRINKISLLETLPKPITDTEGYLVLLDSGVRVLDARQIPMRNKSTTAVMKELAVSPYEGWLSIWKGS